MSERFFVETPITGTCVVLAGDEARHLASVMRAQLGDEVVLFDGHGAEFVARITAVRKQAVELAIVQRRDISRELDFELTLAVALPKGERQKWLVEKLTELGVTRLVPLVTERGVAQPVEAALVRLRRTVIEASKQCGRNQLLEIVEPQEAQAFFRQDCPHAWRVICDAAGQALVQPAAASQRNLFAAIGPEGGFSPAELLAAKEAGWQAMSLGQRILRVETAAVAAAVWGAIARC